jgi:5'-3' exonuclease
MSKILLDGDIVAYRAAYSTNNDFQEDAIDKIDQIIEYILEDTMFEPNPDLMEVYLTGKGNFRFDLVDDYKANRKGVERPVHLQAIRDHMVENWDAIVSEGEEADDLLGIRATQIGPYAVVASIDKDMLQIPCIHYNLWKRTWTTVDVWGGLFFFYEQILTGDTADNIHGLYGIGPAKAKKILLGATTERELFDRCVAKYDGDVDKVIQNGRLLWLRRWEGQLWSPPEEVS